MGRAVSERVRPAPPSVNTRHEAVCTVPRCPRRARLLCPRGRTRYYRARHAPGLGRVLKPPGRRSSGKPRSVPRAHELAARTPRDTLPRSASSAQTGIVYNGAAREVGGRRGGARRSAQAKTCGRDDGCGCWQARFCYSQCAQRAVTPCRRSCVLPRRPACKSRANGAHPGASSRALC